VVQPPYPTPAECRAKIVLADLSGEEFATVWHQVPLWQRALVSVAVIAIGRERQWFGTRATLAQGMSLDDLPSRKELLDTSPETIALAQAVLHARDDRLVARLREQLDSAASTEQRLAIVYGAAHMRAVLRELTGRRKYFVERGDWLTVFAL
jgi:hypothetical protein